MGWVPVQNARAKIWTGPPGKLWTDRPFQLPPEGSRIRYGGKHVDAIACVPMLIRIYATGFERALNGKVGWRSGG